MRVGVDGFLLRVPQRAGRCCAAVQRGRLGSGLDPLVEGSWLVRVSIGEVRVLPIPTREPCR